MSPFDRPIHPPMHSIITSSCSSTSLVAPSPGRNAVTCFPFFTSWTRTHFLIAEFGCFASSWTFSRTIPLAWDVPPSGSDLALRPRTFLAYHLYMRLEVDLRFSSFLAAFTPEDFLDIVGGEAGCL